MPASLTIEDLNSKLQKTLNLPKIEYCNLEFNGNILENKLTRLSDFISENGLKLPLEIFVQQEPRKKEACQFNPRIPSLSMLKLMSKKSYLIFFSIELFTYNEDNRKR